MRARDWIIIVLAGVLLGGILIAFVPAESFPWITPLLGFGQPIIVIFAVIVALLKNDHIGFSKKTMLGTIGVLAALVALGTGHALGYEVEVFWLCPIVFMVFYGAGHILDNLIREAGVIDTENQGIKGLPYKIAGIVALVGVALQEYALHFILSSIGIVIVYTIWMKHLEKKTR